ncbi:hypothetical protein BDV96DRAFT_587435 [Lophiotrema nucula]|uniref:Uncharacterized protein n=1 Tax=Lophiotrema nucula TaxID=690887 RepID=A0A6A5YN40_9PLEO|nr:hypothetical protein BDV96DRAFT_587435 [Lophiotrema nucula]
MEWLENAEGKMLHEMMHINMITRDRPHIEDRRWNNQRAYTAPYIADWVKSGASTADVVQNADSYTQFVNAIHFTDLFGYLPPPRREVPITETHECFPQTGEAQLYVDKFQDQHIADFCNKIAAEYTPGSIGEMVHEYDVDKPEHVRMRFYRRPGGKLGAAAVQAQCLDTMPKLFHGCDTSSKWKHGGVHTFSQGDDDIYTYYLEPRHTRPDPIPDSPPALCNVWSKFAHVEFTISGGLFAGNDHGQGTLLPSLRTCGVVTDWEFHYKDSGEPDENNIEWDATGSLPLGSQMWGCVRWAMIQAGAPESLGCGGS